MGREEQKLGVGLCPSDGCEEVAGDVVAHGMWGAGAELGNTHAGSQGEEEEEEGPLSPQGFASRDIAAGVGNVTQLGW